MDGFFPDFAKKAVHVKEELHTTEHENWNQRSTLHDLCVVHGWTWKKKIKTRWTRSNHFDGTAFFAKSGKKISEDHNHDK
jgi:hypothetical protein